MKHIIFMFSILLTFVLSGCATKIGDYPATKEDKSSYKSDVAEELDYDTNPYVIETLGAGSVACINIGLKDKVDKGVKIEFFHILERNGVRYEIVFATGVVFRVSDDTAWVKVNNPRKVKVRQNHFVRVAADQSKSIIDEFNDALGIY
jgi:hypothetical protein